MKQVKVVTLFIILLCVNGTTVLANNTNYIEIDGIYYEFVESEAVVMGYNKNYKDYYGNNIIIPESVTWEANTYNVTKINKLYDGSSTNFINKVTILSDNIKEVKTGVLGSYNKSYYDLYIHKGTKTQLALWRYFYYYAEDINAWVKRVRTYEIGTGKKLEPSYISCSKRTQTTITLELMNRYDEFTYTWDGMPMEDFLYYEKVYPTGPDNQGFKVWLSPWKVSLGNYSFEYSHNCYVGTDNLRMYGKEISKTASSLTICLQHEQKDAVIKSKYLTIDNRTIELEGTEKDTVKLTGLRPYTKYDAKYYIIVSYGENNENEYQYLYKTSFTTNSLTMNTLQPKVISLGNANIAAETNLDDDEANVGFEWRRTDWGTDFASNTGQAVLYEGTMEGYIRNLNTNFLWKYRPYYLSNSGVYYYGDWVGLDPTNTSYFEPTVHTYANITIQGNTALVKGYALEGTDNITVQGFMYWKSTANAPKRAGGLSIPANATTVVANGQVMTAELTNLDYGTTYSVVAFVTTTAGETFYGREEIFTTAGTQTAIKDIERSREEGTKSVIGCYDINGRRLNAPRKGLNIIRYSDGTSFKVVAN